MDLVSYILAKNNAGGSSSAVSPTAKVTETDDGAVITITDAEGTTTVTIKHGTDGQDGKVPKEIKVIPALKVLKGKRAQPEQLVQRAKMAQPL